MCNKLCFNPNYASGKQNSVQSFVKPFESLCGKKRNKHRGKRRVSQRIHKEKEFLMRNPGLKKIYYICPLEKNSKRIILSFVQKNIIEKY